MHSLPASCNQIRHDCCNSEYKVEDTKLLSDRIHANQFVIRPSSHLFRESGFKQELHVLLQYRGPFYSRPRKDSAVLVESTWIYAQRASNLRAALWETAMEATSSLVGPRNQYCVAGIIAISFYWLSLWTKVTKSILWVSAASRASRWEPYGA